MVVIGQDAEIVHVIVEVLAEPYILAHDLGGLLDHVAAVLLVFAEAPTGIAACSQWKVSIWLIRQEHQARSQKHTRTRLLRNRQRKPGLKRARHKRALAVSRTARHSHTAGIDLRSRCHLQCIDDAGRAPDPGSHGAGGHVAVEVVEEADAAGGGVGVLLGDEAVGVGEDGDL